AGRQIECRCGRTVRVPRLSDLRRAKGMDGGETNARDTIARMIREGTLPWGSCCAVTAMPTNDVMMFDVECQRSYVKGARGRDWGITLSVLGFFFCLPVAIFMWLLGRDLYTSQVKRVGRDVTVPIPLRVSKEAQGSVRAWSSQTRLRNILRSVPIYERLLEE